MGARLLSASNSTTGTTSVPAPVLDATGFIMPEEADMLTGVLADINAAFGNTLNTDLSTPQGQLAMSLTAILGDAYDQFLALANGVDPARAEGRMQDAIGRIYFMSRLPATPTTVTCICTGAAGTVIPQGALIKDQSGNSYTARNRAADWVRPRMLVRYGRPSAVLYQHTPRNTRTAQATFWATA